MAGTKSNTTRPLSPHLQVWRWHVTMATSIFHRATGVALYAGALGVAVWLMAAAAGPGPYGVVQDVINSPIGFLGILGFTLAATFHLANGVRHLVWDAGKGFEPKAANASGWFVIGFAVVATAAILILTTVI
jgi:succinate dehydrogenase / fumarate reductase, cytochrome b subunit